MPQRPFPPNNRIQRDFVGHPYQCGSADTTKHQRVTLMSHDAFLVFIVPGGGAVAVDKEEVRNFLAADALLVGRGESG